nr:hypothetical protein [Rhodococcus sp. (in: high G+C Gram-positive bacteria)]
MNRTPIGPASTDRAHEFPRTPELTVGNCTRAAVTSAVTGLWAFWLAPMTIPVILAPVPILSNAASYWLVTIAIGAAIFIGWITLTRPLPSLEIDEGYDSLHPAKPHTSTTSSALCAPAERGTAA